jgi:peptidyl-prolyl cis-trans isomerase B (cyclophilin B)
MLQGPSLAPLLAADVTSAELWQATLYFEGPNLQAALAAHGPLTGAALRGLASGLASALATLHAAGAVHGALRPTKVMLTPTGPQLLNYRTSSATYGDPGAKDWNAPEQLEGAAASSAADVFGWGLLVAHAATGRLPFGAGTPEEMAHRIQNLEPDLTGVPEDLLPQVAAALSKGPGARPEARSLTVVATLPGAPHAATPYAATPYAATPPSAPVYMPQPQYQGYPGYPSAPPTAPSSSRTAVLIAAIVVAALALGGLGVAVAMNSGGKHPTPVAVGTQQGADPSASDAPPASGDPSGDPGGAPSGGAGTGKQWATEPQMAINTSGAYTATISLGQGTVTIQLYASKAPHAVNSMAFLSKQGYFDNTPCHRLTTSGIYVLQCGDPTGTGSGTPGYSFPDENLTAFGSAGGVVYPAGTLAMANAGPGTNGSQFFLVYKDSPLAPNYTPFGRITGGLDLLRQIAAKGTADGSGDGKPAQPVTISSLKVSGG